jgi:hypothetical protein
MNFSTIPPVSTRPEVLKVLTFPAHFVFRGRSRGFPKKKAAFAVFYGRLPSKLF